MPSIKTIIGRMAYRCLKWSMRSRDTLPLSNGGSLSIQTRESLTPPQPHVDVCISPISSETLTPTDPFSIYHLQEEVVQWLMNVYPDRTHQDVLVKFLEEVAELFKNPKDPDEVADLMILLVDLAYHGKIDLIQAAWRKLEINKRRTWKIDPVTGIMSHVHHSSTSDDLGPLNDGQ